MNSQPLKGIGVLVTRAAEQSEGILKSLEGLGAVPHSIPTVKSTPIQRPSGLEEALKEIASFDAMVFTSANGVRFFADHLRYHGLVPASQPPAVCVGPKTAKAWERVGGQVLTFPLKYSGSDIPDALGENLSGKRYLILRPEKVKTEIGPLLKGRGAGVAEIVLYRTETSTGSAGDLKGLLAQNAIDIITFTSPSSVAGLRDIMGTFDEVLQIPCMCIGPSTADAAVEEGFQNVSYPEEYTVEGMLRMLPELAPGLTRRR